LAGDVLLHRIRLSYEALADGVTKEQVLGEVLRPESVPAMSPVADHPR
jgi:hypothetical protein